MMIVNLKEFCKGSATLLLIAISAVVLAVGHLRFLYKAAHVITWGKYLEMLRRDRELNPAQEEHRQ